MSSPYRILVIAGGGVFGAIPATLLANYFRESSLVDKFDCFAGTSVGGILAMCYASGMNAQDVLHDFKTLSKRAFPRMPWWWRLNPLRTRYSADGLEEVLQEMLPMQLGDLKKPVIIPSIDFEQTKPKVFDTLIKDEDAEMLAWQVGRATSAAPTYFPPFKQYIDGGLMANLPVIEAATAVKHKLGVSYKDMELLVLGTGQIPRTNRDMRKVRHWSRLHWVFPLIHFIARANELRSIFDAKQIGLGKYAFFNPVSLEADWEIDRVDLVPIVESMTDGYKKLFAAKCNAFFKK